LITACGGGGNADDGDDGGPPEEEHPAGDIAGCGSDPLFTVHPVPLADLRAIGPLGFMNPPSHVFPNQHVGFTPPFDEPPVLREPTLSAPGDIRITEVHNISTEVDGLLALIGTEMGPRVGEPLCGESLQDVRGSAQSRFFFAWKFRTSRCVATRIPGRSRPTPSSSAASGKGRQSSTRATGLANSDCGRLIWRASNRWLENT
jgi:hypothetical protein